MIKTKGWLKLESEHGYEVSLKAFMIQGNMQTVVIDNFSVTPLTIQPYNVNDITIAENWENVYCDNNILFDAYDVRELRPLMDDVEDYQEVYDYLVHELEYVREYELTSEDGEVSVIDEYTLRRQANYYLHNSDIELDTNFFDCPMEDVVEFVSRIDKVEEI